MISKFNTSFFKVAGDVFHYLPSDKKKKLIMLLFLIIAFALSETISLASVALFASSVSDPESVINSDYMKMYKSLFGTEFPSSSQNLILSISIVVVLLVFVKNGIKGMTMYWISRFSAQIEAYFGRLMIE